MRYTETFNRISSYITSDILNEYVQHVQVTVQCKTGLLWTCAVQQASAQINVRYSCTCCVNVVI